MEDPDRQIPEVKRHICPLHRKKPTGFYPGCSCMTTYGTRQATNSEYLRRRKARLLQRREKLVRELSEIDAELQRSLSTTTAVTIVLGQERNPRVRSD